MSISIKEIEVSLGDMDVIRRIEPDAVHIVIQLNISFNINGNYILKEIHLLTSSHDEVQSYNDRVGRLCYLHSNIYWKNASGVIGDIFFFDGANVNIENGYIVQCKICNWDTREEIILSKELRDGVWVDC